MLVLSLLLDLQVVGKDSICDITKGQLPELHVLAHTFWKVQLAKEVVDEPFNL